MAQIEMMLRLIKDNKIDGYVWIISYEQAKQYFTAADEYLYPESNYKNTLISMYAENKDSKRWMPVGTINILKPEAIESGIKVNGEWCFEGDRFVLSFNDGDVITILVFEDYRWGFKGNHSTYDINIYGNHYARKIGNIHDNKEFDDGKDKN